MTSNDLAIRFSNEMYATKQQVAKILNTSLVDNIWANILAYRANFEHKLSLRNIEKYYYRFILTPFLSEQLVNLNEKLLKANNKLDAFKASNLYNFERNNLLTSLAKSIMVSHDISLSDEHLNLILNGTEMSVSLNENQALIGNYINTLKSLPDLDYDFDVDLFAEIYQKISGISELVTIFRQEEITSNVQKAIINRQYVAAPCYLIEELMLNLSNFINSDQEIDPIVKSLVTYYFINHIKPFPTHNEEMAYALAKFVLLSNGYGEMSILLPLEELINNDRDNILLFTSEVQKTGDITYLVAFLIPRIIRKVEFLLDEMARLEVKEANQEFFEVKEPASKSPVGEFDDLLQKEESSIKVEKPIEVLKKETKVVSKPQIKINASLNPGYLNGKDASLLEEHLLECNPFLKRNAAYFYARHCTIGKYYTIAQFKKAIGCAYETARTSMEQLVDEGFYKKEQIKNKYVYTPIARD